MWKGIRGIEPLLGLHPAPPSHTPVLEVMVGEELDKGRWEMPKEEEEEEEKEFWGFEDLECDYDTTSFSASPMDSISTGSS